VPAGARRNRPNGWRAALAVHRQNAGVYREMGRNECAGENQPRQPPARTMAVLVNAALIEKARFLASRHSGASGARVSAHSSLYQNPI